MINAQHRERLLNRAHAIACSPHHMAEDIEIAKIFIRQMENAEEVVEMMRSVRPEFGAPGSRDVDVRAKRNAIDALCLRLLHPDLSK